jgi:chondroitin AC lyase
MWPKVMNRLLVLLCLFGIGNCCFAQEHDFDTITRRVVKDIKERKAVSGSNTKVTKYLSDLQADGTWHDINYQDNAAAIWLPAEHLNRLQELTLAYSDKNNSANNQEVLYRAIVKASRAWNIADPKCRNWWYNEIYCPQLLGQIILVMKSSKPLPVSLEDSLLVKMKRGNMYKQTGANKMDVALHNIYRALITRDVLLMDSAVSQCFQPIQLTTAAEGLQYDYSYMQHGPQLQIASYGSVFLTGEYQVAAYVNGTLWKMPDQKSKILANYLNQVFLNTVRYKYFDFNVMGRGFSRKDSGSASAVSGLYTDINSIKRSGTQLSIDFSAYDDAFKRASGNVPASYHIKTLHTQFWKADYTLQVNREYLFTVRGNSVRTRRTETGNGENLYGRYMSDGATNIQRSGSEYFNIFPVWEYDKIPGVTCRNYTTDRPAVDSWDQPGTTNFTGGVSDGVYGASTYTLDYDSVKAKKAWFFFGKQIVCLGAGIQSNTVEHITTAVNQCWSRGEVVVGEKKRSYWHDSIGYYFEPNEGISMLNTLQKGTWKHINSSQPADTVSGKVFKLWIDHGVQPTAASYSYIVIPGISAQQFARQSPFLDLKVIANNNEQQAVYCPGLDMLQVVFYKAGSLQAGKTKVGVDEPCVMMLKKAETLNPELFLADPSQKLKNVTVEVNGKSINCVLPSDQYAGSTFKFSK